MNRISVALGLGIAIGSSGCAPSIDNDGPEGSDGPTVEFDPGASIIPFPNNLVISPTTGRVTLPAQCNESPTSTAVRTGVLNTLDGFGTFKTVLQFTLTEPPDAATLTSDNIKLYRRLPPDPNPVPIVILPPGQTLRYVGGDCAVAPVPIDAVQIVPAVPLTEGALYDVMVGDGIRTATGASYLPSFTWAFVRNTENPVVVENGMIVAERTPLDPTDPEDLDSSGVPDAIETLLGVNQLWNAHKAALDYLVTTAATTRENILLAWEFKTQTVTRPLDPTVTDTLAAALPTAALTTFSLPGTGEQFLQGNLPANSCQVDGGPLPCQAVSDALGGAMVAPNYQVARMNPLTGAMNVPGPWGDPLTPTLVGDATLSAIAFVPVGATPATGWPTIIFGHGITRSKFDLLPIASQLAAFGFASVAIDFVAHGNPLAPGIPGRAVQISNTAGIGCSGTPDPTVAPQCFAPFFSSDLAATRDYFRQTVLDLLTLSNALGACTGGACGALEVDPARIGYLGHSLGGIIGSKFAAMSPDLQGAVINVGGAGLIDFVENTASLGLRCGLVDSLIDAGILTGDKWNLGMNPTTAVCLTDAWKMVPAYRQFATIARWVLDPADPANFAGKLGTRISLIQEVMGDLVVPNIMTDQLAALSGRTPAAADPYPPSGASSAITTSPTTSKWVRYTDLAFDAGTGFPGNTFTHSSVLRPAASITPSTQDGNAGTARMQTDLITFLVSNVTN
jgi:pimeloyl-ACP methyl ester carboxylesterase